MLEDLLFEYENKDEKKKNPHKKKKSKEITQVGRV